MLAVQRRLVAVGQNKIALQTELRSDFHILKPPASVKWKADSTAGTSRSFTVVKTQADYHDVQGLVSIAIEEDVPGPVSVQQYYGTYGLSQSLRLSYFANLYKAENPDLANLISLDTKRRLVKLTRPPALIEGLGLYFHSITFTYLTDPSPFKTNRPVFVKLVYVMITSSSSTTSIDQYIANDFADSNGIYARYKQIYKNYL